MEFIKLTLKVSSVLWHPNWLVQTWSLYAFIQVVLITNILSNFEWISTSNKYHSMIKMFLWSFCIRIISLLSLEAVDFEATANAFLLVRACILIEQASIDLQRITKSPCEKTQTCLKVKLDAAYTEAPSIMYVTKTKRGCCQMVPPANGKLIMHGS